MKNIIIAIILVIVAAGAGFFGGMYYQKSQRSAGFGQGQFAQGGGAGGYRMRFGAGGQNANAQAVRGQILNAGNGTMTVKMPDGSTKLVILSGSTNIMKATKGSQSDLTAGQQVMVFGASNSDGSVTAQAVQVGKMGGFVRNKPSGAPNPTQ